MRVINRQTGQTYFSKRRRRYDDELTPRELTFSCYHRFPFLAKDRSRLWFVESLQAVRTKWPIDLWAWVIMPEHVHLLVAPRQAGIEVGRFAGQLKERVVRRAIAWLEKNNSPWLSRITVTEGSQTRRRFWQSGGGYDRNITEPRTLQAAIEYIHANPIRRGLVSRAEDWEWSSARWYADQQDVRLEMDRTLPVFTH